VEEKIEGRKGLLQKTMRDPLEPKHKTNTSAMMQYLIISIILRI
jgi:hypothetical protein